MLRLLSVLVVVFGAMTISEVYVSAATGAATVMVAAAPIKVDTGGIGEPEILARPTTEATAPIVIDNAPTPTPAPVIVRPKPSAPAVASAPRASSPRVAPTPTPLRNMRLIHEWVFLGYTYPVGTVLTSLGYFKDHDCYWELVGGCIPASYVVLL